MDGTVGRNRQALGLGPANHFHRPCAGQLAEVSSRTGLRHQLDVTRQRRGFSDLGNGRQAEPRGDRPLVGATITEQILVQRLYHHEGLLAGGIIHRATLHQRVGQRLLCVTEGDTAVVAQARHVAQLLAAQPAGEGADRVDARIVTEHLVAVVDQFDSGRVIDWRLCVGRDTQGGNPVLDRGLGFAGNVGFFRLPRIAQSRLAIDQPRQYEMVFGIEDGFRAEAIGR